MGRIKSIISQPTVFAKNYKTIFLGIKNLAFKKFGCLLKKCNQMHMPVYKSMSILGFSKFGFYLKF